MTPQNTKFLWPGFVSTTRCRERTFSGNALFRINLAGKGLTFAVDFSRDSMYPGEEEVLIYPYSGFEVLAREIFGDEVIISLQTCDTLLVDESMGCLPIGDVPRLQL